MCPGRPIGKLKTVWAMYVHNSLTPNLSKHQIRDLLSRCVPVNCVRRVDSLLEEFGDALASGIEWEHLEDWLKTNQEESAGPSLLAMVNQLGVQFDRRLKDVNWYACTQERVAQKADRIHYLLCRSNHHTFRIL